MYRMIPDLMDITQLIRYIFWETARETAHRENPSAPSSAFIADDANPATVPVIRFTAFIDEYYYEEHPLEHTVDPDLWRKFVNAQPREMHILSDARQSRDRKSDVILSSHSIIQQSIQSIYNIYSADLHTLWGTEHEDEMRKLTDGWPYWPGDPMDGVKASTGRSGNYDTELGKWNGRLNTAYIWELYSSDAAGGSNCSGQWDTFMEYNVHNEIPELKGGDGGYQGMAYSCLTRNRDNNGDGVIDRSEIRWYLAACNQLAGMWVGNESLSINARLYMPAQGQWRAHIVSSSGKRVSWSEEGGGATEYNWDFMANRHTWSTIGEAAAGETVRCLRNIGTFTDGGTLKDISYAPYDYEIEPYFTKEGPEPEGPFTFYFDRLNPKSLRQMSQTELPYADQFNLFNSVYLKFETQSRADNVGDTDEDSFSNINTRNPGNYPTNETINLEVSQLGHNPYCPPGYRFPNHTEMLLMSLYLPQEYFECDKDGTKYSNSITMPTRTYYDRGYYGNNTLGMSPTEITNERGKVGWGYTCNAHKQSCMNRTQNFHRSRCVRDVDMTGWIDGDIEMLFDKLYPGEPTQLRFNFYSSASSFVSASLMLCYTDRNGLYHEQDIPVETAPSGMQFVSSQLFTLPTAAQMDLEDNWDGTECKFKITLRNTSTSRTIEHPFRLVASHLARCSVSLPSESDPDKGIPVRVHIGSLNTYAHLTNVSIHWKAPGGAWQNRELEDGTGNISSLSKDVYLKDLIGDAAWNAEENNGYPNRYKEYQFYVTASCSDGSEYVSETLANQLVKFYFTPNPVPDVGWTKNNYATCDVKWQDTINDLNFSNGDYIEVDMDLSNCVYVYIDGNQDHDMGKDNLIGFGTSDVSTITNSFIWYYPSVQNLVAPPGDVGRIFSRIHAGIWSAAEITGRMQSLNLVLDKDGIKQNGSPFTLNPGEWNSRVKPALTSANKVYVGSKEGKHLSRATYRYVRVVRVKDPAVTPVPRD